MSRKAEVVERDARGRAISEGDLYQLPSAQGLVPGCWVYIGDSSDKYGQVVTLLEAEYDVRARLGGVLVYNVGGGAFKPDIRNCSLYLIRGRAQTKAPSNAVVSGTISIN